jgi:hypothetical protein
MAAPPPTTFEPTITPFVPPAASVEPPPTTAAPMPPHYVPPAAPARRNGAGVALGVVLVVVGLFYLLVQVAAVDLSSFGWPLIVIIPGVTLLIVGFISLGTGAAIPGGILTMVGLVLAYQNSTGHWTSWAYAWALVAPGAVGVGIALKGLVRGSRGELREGLRVAGIGLVIFLVGLGFFEGVLQISGETLGSGSRLILPALLILAGLGLLVRNLNRGRAARPQPPETTSPRS